MARRGCEVGRLLLGLAACLFPVLSGVPTARAEPTDSAPLNTPFLGRDGELRLLLRPEFRNAPGLLDDLKRFGIDGLEVELVGPLVRGPDPRAAPVPSRLVLKGKPEAVTQGREVLRYLDVPRPSVMVSLLVAEVRCRQDRALGGHLFFDRDTVPESPNTLFRGLFSEFEPDAYLRSSLTGARRFPGTTLRFGHVGTDILEHGAFELVLRLLAQQGDAEFLVWPTVVCTEGMPGKIVSLTSSEQLVVTSSTLSSTSIRPRSFNTGVTFEVTPVRVGTDAAVLDLQADLEFAEPESDDGLAAGTVLLLRRRVKTRVTIRDQESLLIGGLRIRRRLRKNRGLPLFRAVPLLSGQSRGIVESELILLVRARVLVPSRGAGVVLPPGEARRLEAARRRDARDARDAARGR